MMDKTGNYSLNNMTDFVELNASKNKTEMIITFIFMIIVSVVATFGNLLIITAVIVNTKLRTNTDHLLANLAVADLLQGAVAIPLRMVELFNTGATPLIPCLVVIPVSIFSAGSSCLFLSMVSLDRFMGTVFPLKYSTLVTDRVLNSLIIFIWVFSSALTALPFCGWGKIEQPVQINICLYTLTFTREYLLTVFAFELFLPVCVLLFTNFYIFRAVRSQVRRIQDLDILRKELRCQVPSSTSPSLKQETHQNMENRTVETTLTTREELAVSVKDENASRCTETGLQIVDKGSQDVGQRPLSRNGGKLILCTVFLFIVLTVPIGIIDLISLWCSTCVPVIAAEITVCMVYMNACVNCFVYSGYSTEYRKTFKRILKKICVRKSSEAVPMSAR